MTPIDIILIIYGALIMLIDAYGIWRPRLWIEWTERQLIFKRVRIFVGSFFVLLGLVPIYWLVGSGWWVLLIVVCAIWFLIGALILSFADTIRQLILTFGGLSDKVLRILFIADAAFGLVLLLMGLL